MANVHVARIAKPPWSRGATHGGFARTRPVALGGTSVHGASAVGEPTLQTLPDSVGWRQHLHCRITANVVTPPAIRVVFTGWLTRSGRGRYLALAWANLAEGSTVDGTDPDRAGTDAASTQTYLALITHPHAKRNEIAQLLAISRTELDRRVADLAAQGSVRVHPDGSWDVPPPDITLPARASELERQALQIRATADQLAVIYHQARAQQAGDQTIEVLGSREEVARYFVQVMGAARQRVRSLDRPPFTRAEHAVTDVQRQQAAEGVRFLTVYDTDVLQGAQSIAALERLAALGEQMRVLKGVPLKMVVADDDTALVIVRTDDESWRGSMLVRRSPLLDALTLLFETLWRLSVPLHRPERELGNQPDQPPLRDRQVLMMLAGGATDETIARQLGVSSRTVERRVRALLDRLGANTRFQAGVQAARRGWL